MNISSIIISIFCVAILAVLLIIFLNWNCNKTCQVEDFLPIIGEQTKWWLEFSEPDFYGGWQDDHEFDDNPYMYQIFADNQ